MISSVISPAYRAQVDLLLQVMPHVAKEDCFALKGCTAINMFIWNIPRLSVDIDLTYLPFDDRNTAMKNISAALHRIKDRIDAAIHGCKTSIAPQTDGQEAKLTCQHQGAQIKIEVNTTIRGHLFAPQEMDVTDAVEEAFKRFVSMRVVAPAELFGGKICAALDRQHPRDLFDIQQLYAQGGLTDDIRQGFLVYLLSSNRPIHEMIRPNFLDQRRAFETQFAGMTQEPFSYEDFEAVRERLVKDIHAGLKDGKDLKLRTKSFALRIVRMYAALPKSPEAQIIEKQVLRSGTSVGANYREAYRSRSDAEFIAKIGDCLKELDETQYWLELLVESNIVSEEKLSGLQDETNQMLAIFTTISKNTKQRLKEAS